MLADAHCLGAEVGCSDKPHKCFTSDIPDDDIAAAGFCFRQTGAEDHYVVSPIEEMDPDAYIGR